MKMLKLQRAWCGQASMPLEASDTQELFLDERGMLHVSTPNAVAIMLNVREVAPYQSQHAYEQGYDNFIGRMPPAVKLEYPELSTPRDPTLDIKRTIKKQQR